MHGAPFEAFLSTHEACAVFDAASLVGAMLRFEAALAQAQAAEGLLCEDAATVIAQTCRPELLDLPALLAASGRAGSLAIPFVQQLRAAVAQRDAEAALQLHAGSTSQDVIDTALVLCTRRALALADRDLTRLGEALLALAEPHRDTPVLARTLMQPAAVTSFGFKLLQWIVPVQRCQRQLRVAGQAALQLQFGGPVGTLSGMQGRGPAVARRVAALLQLPEAQGSWHTQRDAWLRLGCEAGVLCGALGKIARDWSLLGQGEVGELAEPNEPGRGGSSAMPHKHNPVAAMVALAAAQRAPQRVAALLQCMPQEHERGLGHWQAELAEWAGLWTSVLGALHALAEAAPGLLVDVERMRENIHRLGLPAVFDLQDAQAAAQRVDEALPRLRGEAAALSASAPWQTWLPGGTA